MTNLFSIFDPVSRSYLRNWWVTRAVFLAFSTRFYSSKSWGGYLRSSSLQQVERELRVVLGNSYKQVVRFFLSIFLIIVGVNLLGLARYNFTPSRHLVFSLSLALPVWLGFTIFSLRQKLGRFLSHLVPLGTPAFLVPFMVVIETVRNLIRPLTLAIRLSANMVAGHLLLALLGGYASVIRNTLSLSVVTRSWLLLTLELAVALIQGYVFCVLLSLYLKEA